MGHKSALQTEVPDTCISWEWSTIPFVSLDIETMWSGKKSYRHESKHHWLKFSFNTSSHTAVGIEVAWFTKRIYHVPSQTHQGFPEEFILSIILPKVQPAVCIHSPAGEHLHDRLMVFNGSLCYEQMERTNNRWRVYPCFTEKDKELTRIACEALPALKTKV